MPVCMPSGAVLWIALSRHPCHSLSQLSHWLAAWCSLRWIVAPALHALEALSCNLHCPSKCCLAHRMAYVEGDLKDHLVSNPLTWEWLPTTRSGCPGCHPTWPSNQCLLRWGYHLFGQPVPAPHHSRSKELPPDIQPKSSLQLKPISPCPAVIYPFGEFTPFLFIGSLQILKPTNHLSGLPLDPLQQLSVFLV